MSKEMTSTVNAPANTGTKRRFGHLSESEREANRRNVIPQNTLKANRKAANLLKQYMQEKDDCMCCGLLTLDILWLCFDISPMLVSRQMP